MAPIAVNLEGRRLWNQTGICLTATPWQSVAKSEYGAVGGPQPPRANTPGVTPKASRKAAMKAEVDS